MLFCQKLKMMFPFVSQLLLIKPPSLYEIMFNKRNRVGVGRLIVDEKKKYRFLVGLVIFIKLGIIKYTK